MLTTSSFFVKTCFHKSFIIINLRALTEGLREAIFRLRGLTISFFDNRESSGEKPRDQSPGKAKSLNARKTATA
jgi:hypothetical protein